MLEDKTISNSKRWVRVAPSEQSSFSLLLAKAKNKTEDQSIGNQAGGRVFLFLHTKDFDFLKNFRLNEFFFKKLQIYYKSGGN